MTALEDARSALWAISPNGMGNDEWVRVGMAWKEAGGDLGEWEYWSRQDAAKFQEGECARRWKSFKTGGGITESTLFGMARDAGWGGDTIHQSTILPKTPEPLDLTPEQQLRTCLESLFSPSDLVCVVTKAAKDTKSGKWRPSGPGTCHRVGDLLNKLKAGSVEDALGPLNQSAGAWFCPNPVNGLGHKDEDVTTFMYALIESDELPIDEQRRIVANMALPVTSLTLSGGKSAHALVKVEADGPNHYAERVAVLYAACSAAGMAVDTQNKNPGRLTRLPGVRRGNSFQKLVAINQGARTWKEWERERKPKEQADDEVNSLPPIRKLNLTDIQPLRPALIDGILRQGHVMVLGGPSKAGKTQCLIELAVAVATGGRWLGAQCSKGRVLYVDGETDPASFLHRFQGVADRLAPGDPDVSANIDVWNLRGHTEGLSRLVPQIIAKASGGHYDLLVLDPAYKVMEGDENSAHDVGVYCNALDKLSQRLGCSVVYDHHHSKGAQGDKSSMDRVSGSGVFSRHADAIVDLIELVPTEDQNEGTSDSAWRVSATLREFAPMEPFNMWFRHPIHVRDYNGALDEWEPMTAARAGGRSAAVRSKLETLGKVSMIEDIVSKMMEEAGAQRVRRADVEARYGSSRNTVNKLIDTSKKYMRESGVNECWIVPRN